VTIPERKEPGTEEIIIKYFQHLHKKFTKGVLGMELGKSKMEKEGEISTEYRLLGNR